MAFINTLRNKMGKIVVFAISASILAFIAGDLLGPNSTLLGGNSTDVGEIAGQTISLREYQYKIDQMSSDYFSNYGQSPNGDAMFNIRQQAWDALINEKAFYTYFDELGIIVTDDEIWDLTQGKNVDETIKNSFVDQNTGVFERERVIEFLKELVAQPPQVQQAWFSFERNLGPNRRMNKFQNLFLKTNYASSSEAEQEYFNSSTKADVRYVYVPFSSIVDSTVVVTDTMLKDYLSDNENRFKQDEFRSASYVVYDVTPSADDTLEVIDEMEALKNDLAKSQNDSLFARANSDGTSPFLAYSSDLLPDPLQRIITTLSPGDVIGPEFFNGRYVVYKFSSIEEADNYTARASHILIKWDDETTAAKSEARRRANDIINDLLGGEDFGEMARIHSTDGSASNGGDLGWFPEGRMVAPFEAAVFGATKTGLIGRPIESEFGFHIINVTGLKSNISYKIAAIEREITPSDETRNSVFREASLFAASCNNFAEFQTEANQNGFVVLNAQKIGKNDRRIGTLTNGRGIVTWIYNTAEIDDISDVFELDDQYVVVVMTASQPKGNAKLDVVRDELTKKVRDQEKTSEIVAKLQEQTGTLDDIAAAYGDGATVYTMTSLTLNSNTLTGVGLAPEAVGRIFAMKSEERSEPFPVDNGVIMVEIHSIVRPDALEDYSTYQAQVTQRRAARISYSITQAMRKFANIEDERYRFF
ncbi:MAG: SurA N-terminal domain-containing protein [Bacteroidetes bacterium]|nr:SurA N-terminal domain-containing protein [Bacteroidota bacterium]MDA1118914.1 SurA N-terminal domain-containing protein [Bacteroidota bacterium]